MAKPGWKVLREGEVVKLLNETYGPDEIHEIGQAIEEAIEEANLPTTTDGFIQGLVKVTVEFVPSSKSVK